MTSSERKNDAPHPTDAAPETEAQQAKPASQDFSTTLADARSAQNDEKQRAPKADKVKFIGLIAFLVIVAIIIILIWPYIHLLFEPDGLDALIDQVRSAGWAGVLILEAIQFLQVVVAFIPGEVVQVAAGMIYGPWWGAAIILVGCIASSAVIYVLVHKLGAPFVHDMVPEKYTNKFHEFVHSGKFELVLFILFLIPGLPKDVFTYITPLTNISIGKFLVITNVARIPGIVLSTYAADGLLEGRFWESVIMFAVLAVIALVALFIYNRISSKVDERKEQKQQ